MEQPSLSLIPVPDGKCGEGAAWTDAVVGMIWDSVMSYIILFQNWSERFLHSKQTEGLRCGPSMCMECVG